MLRVNEIFFSIQGESSYAGLPCVFIRLSGCNLRCTYCDTANAFAEGDDHTIEEIVAEIEEYGCPLVQVTGGEPLLQKDTPSLVENIADKGYQVLVETNGSLDIGILDTRATIIMDIKCPGSGEAEKNLWSNVSKLRPKDELKLVVMDRTDYEWAKNMVEKYQLISLCKVFFSPVFEALEPHNLAKWILEDRLNVRLQLQIHKYLGVK